MELLKNATSDGPGPAREFRGKGTLMVSGELDGALVQLQAYAPVGEAWATVADGEFAEPTRELIEVGESAVAFGSLIRLRANLSGAGPATNVTVELI